MNLRPFICTKQLILYRIGVTTYSVHPGIVRSNQQHHDRSTLGTIMQVGRKIGPSDTTLHGALTSLYCATGLETATSGAGKFFGPVARQNLRADAWLRDSEGNKRLWELGKSEMRYDEHACDLLDRLH